MGQMSYQSSKFQTPCSSRREEALTSHAPSQQGKLEPPHVGCYAERRVPGLGHGWGLRFGILLGFGFWVLGFLPCLAADLTSSQIQFFENKIRPVLANNCYKCHSQQAEKVKGGLLLDTKEGLLKGGENGPVIVPGDPEKSVLIKAVRYSDPDLQMPPPRGGGKKPVRTRERNTGPGSPFPSPPFRK